MSAYISAKIQVKNPEKLKEYISKLPATMAPYGGTLVYRGKVSKTLLGDASHQIEAVFAFPSEEVIDEWYNSDAYQAIIPIRDEGCTGEITVLSAM